MAGPCTPVQTKGHESIIVAAFHCIVVREAEQSPCEGNLWIDNDPHAKFNFFHGCRFVVGRWRLSLFFPGGARPPTEVMTSFIDDHRGVYGIEPTGKIIPAELEPIENSFADNVLPMSPV